ncbi:DUF6089 family protein [Spirosoma linguale]|uniref:DUF6089 domain-containing protein n=1 Tax=Spirosoma linguale (strain ATCC 33905 / DSM 74 / LMG 10896 / Claus 1) TaxID=504472 RepID=D2QGR3_SPILD|nr:hypothetical protein Slin_5110 [Spirosoma linguale DSM 74]
MKLPLIALSLIYISLTNVRAQYRVRHSLIPYSEVGIGAGSAIYRGDLAPISQLVQPIAPLPRWNIGLHYTRHLTPYFSARASFTWIRLVGDDYTYNKDNPNRNPVQFHRNLHFRNDLKELAVSGIYQFRPETPRPDQRPFLTPYLTLGLALVAHNPQARIPTRLSGDGLGEWTDLQPLGTEGQGQPGYAKPYSLITLAIPVGMGLRWKLNQRLNVSAELSFRYTFTDYLDDVSGLYPNKSDLSNEQAAVLSDRRYEATDARTGQSRTYELASLTSVSTNVRRGLPGNDIYILTQLAVHYLIPTSIKCPDWR